MSEQLQAPRSGVTVRMYRQGLGDCFLLIFRGDDGKPRTMLIDCGVLKGSPDEPRRMTAVLKHIKAVTGGKVDVLVATHEHWDHLCGFIHAESEVPEAEQVWLAWTENPRHTLAQELRGHRARALRAVQSAVSRMRLSLDQDVYDSADAVAAVAEFFGIDALTPLPALGPALDGTGSAPLLGASPATARGLEVVAGRGTVRYCSPGEVIDMPGCGGIRVYVLGPPEDARLIKKSDPSKAGKEVYESGITLDGTTALLHAAEAQLGLDSTGSATEDQELRELSLPFDRIRQTSPQAARSQEWYRRHYFGAANPEDEARRIPPAAEMDWRRIDDDWTEAVSQVALQLDSDTNNTSLVLAIELVASGKVLLFPGDAQVGNWLSWEALQWGERELGPGAKEVTAQDLLRRTVFYKVGHHASHNATLRAKGLELMESPELVAMIPVDETIAHRPKGRLENGWDMPFRPLLNRLEERTRGRVIRADRDVSTSVPPASTLSQIEWDEFRRGLSDSKDFFLDENDQPTDRRLYVEFTVSAPEKQ